MISRTYIVASTLLFSLHLLATGLLRSIEAQGYKPNSLWFCFISALLIILGAALIQKNFRFIGKLLCGAITLLVFVFYLYSFISAPEKDANLRVGAIILTSFAQLIILFFPKGKA